MSKEGLELLKALLNFAVSEGRSNWDSYYGHDNKFHLETIKESEEYKRFTDWLEEKKGE
jgi:hypothetical protein